MRLGKTTLIHFSTQIGKSLAGFIATLAIARFLGPSTLGTYAIAVATIFWITIPATAYKEAIKKRVSEGSEQGAYLSAGIIWNIGISVVAASGILLFASSVNEYVGAEISELIAVLLVANIGLKTVQGGLEGEKQVAVTGILETIERIIRTGAQLGFIFAGYAISGLVIGHVISLWIATILGVFLFNVTPQFPRNTHFHRLWTFARYSWLGSLKTRSFAWMDTVVLALFAVQTSLIGIYEVTWTLASTLAIISISVKTTLFPELSELAVEDEYRRIQHYLNEGLVFTGIFGIPGLFGAAVIGPRLLKIYRPEFKAGAIILLILIIARLFAAYESQFLGLINAVDRPDIAFRINVVFIAVNLVLNVLLIHLYGWYGAALATAISAGISLVLGYYALSTLIGKPSIPFTEFARQVFASLVMVAVVIGIEPLLTANHYTTVGLVIVGGGVYSLVIVGISPRVRQKAVGLFSNLMSASS